MSEILAFFQQLFSTDGFPARWWCGHWTSFHGWFYILSDIGIWSAYFAIPVLLLLFVKRRKDIPFPRIFWLFAAFIFACGATHLLDAVMFWWPAYRFANLVYFGTAVISWVTVFALVPVIPKALSLRSPMELEQLVQERTQEIMDSAAALAESEKSYRFLVEGAKDYALLMLQPDGLIGSWNPGAERLYGYPKAEVIGTHFSMFFLKEDQILGKPQEELKVASALGRYESEGIRRRKDGSRFWASTVVNALYDDNNKLIGFSKVTQDITKRKQWESILSANEARMRAILGATVDAIITIDTEGNVVEWNPAAERIFGYSRSEVLGQKMAELIIPLSLREAHRNGLKHYFDTGKGPILGQQIELTALDKAGTEFPVELSIVPIVLKEMTLFTGFARNIAQRKQVEEEIHQLTAELESRVAERTHQLETVNKELEAFSYSVSHDLRAPLRSIDGYSQALLEDYSKQLDETGKNYLRRVRANSQQMAALIDDMLQLSRLTRVEFRTESVNLSEIAQAIVADLQEQEPTRQVEFKIENNLTCEGDKLLLQVVLQNLLGNAWKFTSKHPVAHIEFGAKPGDNQQVYYVKDDGAGFDMGYADKLFGAFQRLHGVNEFPGSGIGLATVARIIHRHGGEVWAEGGVEKGATFYFTL